MNYIIYSITVFNEQWASMYHSKQLLEIKLDHWINSQKRLQVNVHHFCHLWGNLYFIEPGWYVLNTVFRRQYLSNKSVKINRSDSSIGEIVKPLRWLSWYYQNKFDYGIHSTQKNHFCMSHYGIIFTVENWVQLGNY